MATNGIRFQSFLVSLVFQVSLCLLSNFACFSTSSLCELLLEQSLGQTTPSHQHLCYSALLDSLSTTVSLLHLLTQSHLPKWELFTSTCL